MKILYIAMHTKSNILLCICIAKKICYCLAKMTRQEDQKHFLNFVCTILLSVSWLHAQANVHHH